MTFKETSRLVRARWFDDLMRAWLTCTVIYMADTGDDRPYAEAQAELEKWERLRQATLYAMNKGA